MTTGLNPTGLTSFTDTSMDQPQFNIYGPLGCGKTTMAVTASEFAPEAWPKVKVAKGAKLKDLSDTLIIAFDRDPAIGLAERGFKVEQFLVRRFMADERLWKKAKFHNAPDYTDAVAVALEVAAEAVIKRGKKWLIWDTISAHDMGLEGHYRLPENMPKSHNGSEDTQRMWGMILAAHRLLHQTASSLPCGLIYTAHVKAYRDDMSPDQKRAKIAVTGAGLPDLVPMISGKGALVYKVDATMEFFIKASFNPKDGLVRTAYTADATAETKNRLELSIPSKVEPHLGKVLRMMGVRK